MILQGGKPKYSEEDLSSGTSSTKYPTRTELRSNPEFRGKRPAADRLSHGTEFEDLNTSESHTKVQSVSVTKKSVDVFWRHGRCLF